MRQQTDCREQRLVALARINPLAAEQAWALLAPERRATLLNAVSPADRAALLLLSADATELVQSLSSPVLLETLRSVPDDAFQALLSCASPAQVEDCLELDCMRGLPGDRRRFRRWLERFLEAGFQWREEFWRGIDLHLLAHLLRPSIQGFAIPEDEAMVDLYDDLGVPFRFTPEMILTRHAGGRDDLIAEFLTALEASEPAIFHDLCRLLLEGDRYGNAGRARRRQRLRRQRLGLPTPEEARQVCEPIEVAESSMPALGSDRAVVPRFDREGSFLAQVLRALDEQDSCDAHRRSVLAEDLRRIANAILVLDDERGEDPEDAAWALARAMRTVGLGMEQVAGGNPALAATLLDTHETEHLFRLGHGLLRLIPRRLAAVDDGAAAPPGHGAWSAPGMADLIRSLAAEAEPRFVDRDGRVRTVACLADLQEALEAIDLLGVTAVWARQPGSGTTRRQRKDGCE